MKQVDFLIVGQGIAGTMAAYFLKKEGASVYIIDDSHQHCASAIAAGLINPITGRRFAKSWRIDDFLPFAKQTYQELESILQVPIFHERPILRALFSVKEENDWLARSGMPVFEPYMSAEAYAGYMDAFIQPAHTYVETHYCAQVDMGSLLHGFAELAQMEGWMHRSPFYHDQVHIRDASVRYQDIQAKGIIFCEGFGMMQNPFFPNLPVEGAKGEVLLVRIPNFPNQVILKHRIFVAPLGQELFWVGSNYDWDFVDGSPTQDTRQFLIARLDEALKVPYEIVDQRAAIRPTIPDRRPLLGRHPIFPQLVLFNGMGTKGASLAPFWAAHLAQVLLKEQPLDPEVDFRRFREVVAEVAPFLDTE